MEHRCSTVSRPTSVGRTPGIVLGPGKARLRGFKELADVACLICGTEASRPVWRQDDLQIDKCARCGVLFVVERPTERDLIHLYGAGALHFERPDPENVPTGPPPAWKVKEHGTLLHRLAGLGLRSGQLLDVGCLSGMFLQNARAAGFEVHGVEPNDGACLYIRKVFGLDVFHGSLTEARYDDARFSVVTLHDVIEHVSDPPAELREVFRVLQPEGILLLATPNAGGLPQRVVKAKRWLARQPWCPIDDVPWHLWGFTPQSLSLCVRKAGFIVKEVLWLEPSPLSTNSSAGSSKLKNAGLRLAAHLSKVVGMSDRFALLAQKAP